MIPRSLRKRLLTDTALNETCISMSCVGVFRIIEDADVFRSDVLDSEK